MIRNRHAELRLANATSPTGADNSPEIDATGDRDITLGPDPANAPPYETDYFRGTPNGSNLRALRDETALSINTNIISTPKPERQTNGEEYNLLNPGSPDAPITLYHGHTPQGPVGP